jgi:hypothetical protein
MCLSHLIYTVRPCLMHTCHAAPMPCSDHAVLLKATAQHGRRETAYGLPSRFRLLAATTRKHTKPPHNNPYPRVQRVVSAQYKKDDLLNCWTSSSDISGYHADFHEGHGHCWSRAGERHGMCELTHGMAGEQHEHGMLCVNPP